MAEPLKSPYRKGNTLTLKIRRPGSKNVPSQLTGQINELRVKIVHVIEPSTLSVVLKVELEDEEAPAPIMILKLYDRHFSARLREFKEMGAATSASEAQFIDFVRQGSMPDFVKDCEENGSWASEKWDTPKKEAYLCAKCTQGHEIELEVYDRLVAMQGIHVPSIYADVRMASQQATVDLDESLTEYTDVRGILMEYIAGFPLNEIVMETPDVDWAPICERAIEIIRKISDGDFINFDIRTENILVRRGEDGAYEVFYLDFADCGFRDPSDSDEVWRARKSEKNEEGAVGYVMMNYISRAKGKKGRKYKGPLPLPWEYTPSSRFEGEYIELYKPIEELPTKAD